MKILFMDFTLPYLINDSGDGVGGWAVELGAWLRGLGEIGHQAGVLTWKGATDYIEKEVNFDLLDTYDPDRGVKVLKYFYYYIPSMLRTARKYNPDIIIQATACLNTGIMAFIASRIGVPFVYRVANVGFHTQGMRVTIGHLYYVRPGVDI